MPAAMSRPSITLAMVDGWLSAMDEPAAGQALALAAAGAPMLVGRRGYARDTMGVASVNDRGIFDDAMVLLIGGSVILTFNANTDPSLSRPGIAELVPGVYRYSLGIHGVSRPVDRQYPALVQAGPVTIGRDGSATVATGYFGINIHKGGTNDTHSLGCQTIWRPQWADFYARIKDAMTDAHITKIPYVLTERTNA